MSERDTADKSDASAKSDAAPKKSSAAADADAASGPEAEARAESGSGSGSASGSGSGSASASGSGSGSASGSESDSASEPESGSAGDAKATTKPRAPKTKPKPRNDDPASWGVPRFAADFPDDPRLATLVRAFADGNYARVKTDGDALVRDEGAGDEVRAAARLLVARTQPDPTSKLLFLFAGGLLVFLTAWWLTHDRPAERHEPPPKVEIIR